MERRGDEVAGQPQDETNLTFNEVPGVTVADPTTNPTSPPTTDFANPTAESSSEAPDSAPTEPVITSMSEDESSGDGFEDLVFFVHGTFSYYRFDRADPNNRWRWWLADSDFYTSLQRELPQAKLVPAGHRTSLAAPPWWWRRKRSSLGPQTGVFHWSGANSESARRTAGRRLLEHIDQVLSEPGNEGRGYHIIAHSHGGNVVWEALRLAHQQKLKREDKPYAVCDRLKSWITVGTPFMRYRADWPRLTWYLIWLLSFLCVAWNTAGWWSDFWIFAQHLDTTQDSNNSILISSSLGSYLYFAAVHVVSLFSVLFPLNVLWRLYRWIDSGVGASDVGQNEEREQTKFDFLSSLFVALIVATAGVGLLLPLLRTDDDFAYPFFLAAWRSEILLASAWTFALLGGILASIVGCLCVIGRGWTESSREKSSAKTWEVLKDKHRALPQGWEHVDEPTIGLRAILEVPEDRIVPRLAAPGADRFTAERGVRHPEFERDRAQLMQWSIEFLLLAYSIPRDWIVRPFYNDVFAPLVDRFVLTRLWKAAHGTDLLGARIAAVTHSPGPVMYLEQWQEPPPEVWSRSLHATMNEVGEALSSYLDRLRRSIGLNSIAAVRVLEILKQALGDADSSVASDPEESRLLAHTCYFRQLDPTNGSIAQEIARHLRGRGASYVPPSLPRRPAPRKRPPCDNIQHRFFAWAAQTVVVLFLVLTPAGILTVTGYWHFFPWSHSALLDTAIGYSAKVKSYIATDEVGSIQSRRAWMQYLGSLPVDVAVNALDESAPRTPENTLAYWQIEYAAMLATRQPRNIIVAIRLLDDVSEQLRTEAVSNETVNRAHHLLGAINYVSSKYNTDESRRMLVSLSAHVTDWLRERYSESMVAEQVQEFRDLAEKSPDMLIDEVPLRDDLIRCLHRRQYQHCVKLMNDFPPLGNGQLAAAALVLNSE